MAQWGVIPSIRVRDMAHALAFYRGTLGFTLDSGGDEAANSSLTREDAHVMIETAADHFGDEYNAAIRNGWGRLRPSPSTWKPRTWTPSTRGCRPPKARASSTRSPVGPGARTSSRSRTPTATGSRSGRSQPAEARWSAVAARAPRRTRPSEDRPGWSQSTYCSGVSSTSGSRTPVAWLGQ